MIFNVSEIENQDKYRLLTGGITPRPIAWISTRSSNNIDNLAPYSFFSVASCNPPVLMYTEVVQRNGVAKDTLQNLLDTKECVVNIVNPNLLESMSLTSASIDSLQSEFSFANVESCFSHSVLPLSVKESMIRYECSLREVLTVSDLPTGGSVVFLDVKCIYVEDRMYDHESKIIDQTALNSPGKLGGDYYSVIADLVELKRP